MKTFFYLMIIVLLCSCDSKNDIVIEEEEFYVKIESYYKLESDNKLYADTGTDVFVYYGIYTSDIIGYTIDGNGILTVKGEEIKPDKHLKVKSDGKCEFPSEKFDDKITILLASNFYKDKITQLSYPNSKDGIIIKSISYN